MCHANLDTDDLRVCLFQCGHGTFHLNTGSATLHLSEEQIVLIDLAIRRWAQRHPQRANSVLCQLQDQGLA